MHNSHGMAEVERHKNLVDVVADVVVRQHRIQGLEIRIINVFEDKTSKLPQAERKTDSDYRIATSKIQKMVDNGFFISCSIRTMSSRSVFQNNGLNRTWYSVSLIADLERRL